MKLGTIIAAGALSVAGCDVVGTLPPAGMAQPQFSSVEEALAFLQASDIEEISEATKKAIKCKHLAEKLNQVDSEKTRNWLQTSAHLENLAISRAIKQYELVAPVTDFLMSDPEFLASLLADPQIVQVRMDRYSDYYPGLDIGMKISDPSSAMYELARIDAVKLSERGATGAEIYASEGCDVLVGLAKAEFGFAE